MHVCRIVSYFTESNPLHYFGIIQMCIYLYFFFPCSNFTYRYGLTHTRLMSCIWIHMWHADLEREKNKDCERETPTLSVFDTYL